MIFTKKHYLGLALAISFLTLGFILMGGSGSQNPDQFQDEIFSFRRITLAPLVIIGSYIAIIFLILKREH